MALLEVEGLRSGYERLPVIFGIHLTVSEGEIVALLGLNGAGKTTTLRAISGMIPVLGGRVSFGGEDVTGRTAERIARRGLLHVPEGRGIFPNLRVDESLRLAAALAKLDSAEAGRRVDEAYTTFPSLERRRAEPAGAVVGRGPPGSGPSPGPSPAGPGAGRCGLAVAERAASRPHGRCERVAPAGIVAGAGGTGGARGPRRRRVHPPGSRGHAGAQAGRRIVMAASGHRRLVQAGVA